MNHSLRKTLIACAVAGGTLFGVAQFTNADQPESFGQALANGTAHINIHEPFLESKKKKNPELVAFLQSSWYRGEAAVLRDIGESGQANWKLVNAGDVDLELTNKMTIDEASSFNRVLNCKETNGALQIGDVFPAVLIRSDGQRVIQFWERKNGDVVYFDMQKEGSMDWTLVQGPVEIKAATSASAD